MLERGCYQPALRSLSILEIKVMLVYLQDQVLLEPAVLVNSFDVTGQKQLEVELEATKKQLLM